MQELDAVLRWVNETRQHHLNMPALVELPRGSRCDPEDCPVARALCNAFVCDDQAIWDNLMRPVRLPDHVQQFVLDFDAGQYPELAIPA